MYTTIKIDFVYNDYGISNFVIFSDNDVDFFKGLIRPGAPFNYLLTIPPSPYFPIIFFCILRWVG